jgi:hypothetical protein
MTLIMGCITRDYAVLASDRRLVWHAPGRKVHRTPAEENRNKAVLLCGQFYLGYTGLAAIERTDTDQWLAERLIEKDPSKYFGTIAEESTRAFRWLRGDKRQAYLIVGWNVPEATNDPHPLAVLITNYLADNGRTWLRQARDEFTVRGYTIPPSEDHVLCWVGQELFPPEIEKLRRYLDLHIRRGGGPRGIAWLLATQIRAVAERNPLSERHYSFAAFLSVLFLLHTSNYHLPGRLAQKAIVASY